MFERFTEEARTLVARAASMPAGWDTATWGPSTS